MTTALIMVKSITCQKGSGIYLICTVEKDRGPEVNNHFPFSLTSCLISSIWFLP